MTEYDVAIAGAGPAGSAAAIALARGGARVALHDRGVSRAIGESLVPSASTLLAELGVLDRFLADAHAPCYGNLSAWGTSELAEQDFIRSPYGHGWHLDRARFDAMLRDAARDAGATLVDVLPDARMTIDATGRASAIARARGVRRVTHDQLIAFFAVFTTERQTDHDSRTLVESAPEGWFHTARLPNATRVVTFFTDEGPPRLPIESTVHVAAILADHGYTQAGPIRSADARSARLEHFHGDDWLAVGDAALSFDPLSSQGILAALYSGVKAANAVLSGELDAYSAALTSLWDAFVTNQKAYYAMETRWRTPFWACRLQ
ncbi:MAG TPA: tryptophan 7-halogenase [Thermoanaerobaculia bacterium]|jgi:flavin-dependent dehydrogenase